MKDRRMSQGYTLIEVMVAMLIFSIMAAMVLTIITAVVSQYERMRDEARNLSSLQTAIESISRDFRQLVNRPVVNSIGRLEPALLVSEQDGKQRVELTRSGVVRAETTTKQSSLQRIMYELEGEQLLRYTWPALDGKGLEQATKVVLLNNVTSLQWQYFDRANKRYDVWPPTTRWRNQLPSAVEVKINLLGLGEVNRILMVFDSEG